MPHSRCGFGLICWMTPVVKAQWHLGATAEPVAAPRPWVGLDAVAEVPQLRDVPPDRALGDLHPLGQLAIGPRRTRRKQRDQPQQAP